MYLVDNARSDKELERANVVATQVIDASRSRTEGAINTLLESSKSKVQIAGKQLEENIREKQYKIPPKTNLNNIQPKIKPVRKWLGMKMNTRVHVIISATAQLFHLAQFFTC